MEVEVGILKNMHNKDLASKIIKNAKSHFKGEVEVFISTHKSLQIDILDGEVEALDSHSESGVGVRVLDQGKLGFAYTSELGADSIDDCLNKAIHNSKCTAPNEHLSFSKEHKPSKTESLYDSQISKTPLQEKIDIAKSIEAAARGFDKRILKTEKTSYEESEYEVYLQTSGGFAGGYRGNHCGGFAMVIAGDGKKLEAGMGFSYAKKFKKFDPLAAGTEAAQHAIELLGARSTKSRKTTLVFDPLVAAQILGILSTPLSGEALIKGKSLFANKKEKAVAAKMISIVDDGLLEDGLATSPFDGEGIPSRKTMLVKNGVLQGFIHNIYSANKLEKKPTGNSARGSYHGMPILAPTNFYIENGKKSPDKLIKEIKDGIYITRVMGLHTANPISGDFSFGAQGIVIENGEKTYPTRGITIAGNIIDLFKSITAIGNDLRFTPTVGSPTLVVENVAVGGN